MVVLGQTSTNSRQSTAFLKYWFAEKFGNRQFENAVEVTRAVQVAINTALNAMIHTIFARLDVTDLRDTLARCSRSNSQAALRIRRHLV